jgi:hypothetical protein
MNVYRPLRAALFFYELLRLFLLAAFFTVFSPLEGAAKEGVFPYLVYVTPNALFPLMTLFIWLKPGDYRNYLPLYTAGKVIAAAAFYGWGFFSLRSSGLEYLRMANLASVMEVLILFGGGFLLNLFDILSVFGSWALARKFNSQEESAGLLTGENGGL